MKEPIAQDSAVQGRSMKLRGRSAIITGAGSGIGREIARLFALEGARVVVADLDREAAEATAREIVSNGGIATGMAMDVTDEQQVNAGVAAAVSEFGAVDVLVSNAGIQIVHPIEEFTFSEWKNVMAVHLDGAFLTTRACLRHMYSSHRGGSIIYIGSVHSKQASPLKAAYVTAKHGLLGLCRSVAREGAKYGVRACVVCPGFVRTPLVDKQIPQQARALGITEEQVVKDVMLKETVDGEFTTTEDVAEVALFLAAFKSKALTGQSLIVSHGWFME